MYIGHYSDCGRWENPREVFVVVQDSRAEELELLAENSNVSECDHPYYCNHRQRILP